MENDRLQEHKSLIYELTKGKELANDLAKHLRETPSSGNSERLVENILASYSEALLILSGIAPEGQCQTVISPSSDPPGSSISLCNVSQSKDSSSSLLERKYGEDIQTVKIIEGAPDEESLLILTGSAPQGQCQSVISSSSDPPGSSISFCKVTQSKDSSSGLLKRKSRQDIRTMQIIGEEYDDGYCWRKFGQKDILGSKYPRGYYRCAHRHSQGCLATKVVQRSDDDPTKSDVTYRGVHTCQAGALASKLAS